MFLRWLHERVAFKPWRPWVESGLRAAAFFVGLIGKAVKRLGDALRSTPQLPPLAFEQLRQIVVIRPDRIGDAVLSTPALRALRKAAPRARIVLIASPATAGLMQRLSCVDEVVTIAGDRFADWWRSRSALRRLRDSKPDLVIALQSAWPAAALAWWLGGLRRAGFDAGGMGWLFTDAVRYPFFKKKTHQVLVNLSLLESLGVAVPPAERVQLEVPVTEEGKAEADAWLREQGLNQQSLIVIHPGSRSKYTQWPTQRFAAVADALARQTGNPIVILCGPGEESIVNRMRAAMRAKPVIAAGLSLEAVIALFERCRLFIGNATGTMHLASAVCPRVVAIIGGTHPQDCPERWRPWGKQHRVVHKTPEETIGRCVTHWVGPEGLRFILPQDVLAAAAP